MCDMGSALSLIWWGTLAAAALTGLAMPFAAAWLGLRKSNFAGKVIPAAGGLTPLAFAGVALALHARMTSSGPCALLLVVVGFGGLGLIDDIWGSGDVRGLRGHLRVLRHGQFTTGTLKLVGGLIVAYVAARAAGGTATGSVVSALVIALCANMFNLLDVRPGRAVVPFVAVATVLSVLWHHPPFHPLASVALGAALILPFDVSGRVMLGDTGSNLIGAALGFACVARFDLPGELVIAATFGGIHLAAERWSLSRLIQTCPPLAAIDRCLGVRR